MYDHKTDTRPPLRCYGDRDISVVVTVSELERIVNQIV